MANASQRHKLDIRGYDSLGGRKALFKVMSNSGTNTREAVIELYGLWSGTDTIRVVTNIGGGNVNSDYSPSGNEDASAAATGLAAVINGKADHTATASVNHVLITKTTAGNLDVVDTLFI
jgi:hypothetical protein